MNFTELLKIQAEKHPDKPALIFRDTSVSFKELKTRSYSVAAGLSAQGLRKADKIAIFLPNFPEYIYSLLGSFILRAVCVPLDYMLTEEEIINFLNHSESRFLIAQEKKGVDFSAIKARCPALEKIFFLGGSSTQGEGFFSYEDLIKVAPKFVMPEVLDKDISSIFYTSGSTGHPKGVLLSYSHLKNPLECFEYFIHPTQEDSLICAGVPFSHLGGLDYLLFMLYFGITLMLMERFQPFEFLRNIEKYRSTIFCIVPSMYVAVLSLKEYDKFDLSSLRFAVVFGAPSSPVLLERFHKVCPNAYLLNGWGMTETSAPNSFLPTGTNTKEILHTGKFPPGTEIRIVDDAGSDLAPGKEGELWIRGKGIMVGYFKESQLTQEVLTKEGWLKTGDIARLDTQGRLSIVGRKKEMIKVSGEIVFCPEVEEALHRHPKIKEAAVIGIADKMRGEVPKAFIVVKEGEMLNDEELRIFLRQHMAHFKIPHYFEFISQLPKNRVGKVDKEKLKVGLVP